MRTSLIYIALASIVAYTSYVPEVHADVISTVATAGIADMTGKDLINKAQTSADEVLDRGQSVGSALIDQGANNLNVLVSNARIQFGAEIDKKIGEMSAVEQQLAVVVYQTMNDVNKMEDKAYEMKDTTVLDIAQLEDNLIFPTVPDFFVQSIRGVAFKQEPGDYTVAVYAHGIDNDSDVRADISVTTADGNALKLTDVSHTQAGVAELHIAQDQLDQYFSDDKLVQVPIKIIIQQSKHHLFWWSTSGTYTVPVTLSLFPHKVATAYITWQVPTFDWVDTGSFARSPSVHTDDRDGCTKSSCEFVASRTISVSGTFDTSGNPDPGSLRLVWSTTHWICEQNDNAECRLYEIGDISPHANGQSVVVGIRSHTHPRDYHAEAATQVYKQVGASDGKLDNLNFYFDKITDIKVPASAALITLHVKTFTKKEYDWNLLSDADQMLKVSGQATDQLNRTIQVTAIAQ